MRLKNDKTLMFLCCGFHITNLFSLWLRVKEVKVIIYYVVDLMSPLTFVTVKI